MTVLQINFNFLLLVLFGLIATIGGLEQCYKCDSRQDPNCAQRPDKIETFEPCDLNTTFCYHRIDKGATLRACAAASKYCEEDDLCIRCKYDKCNKEMYPPDRPKCLHCTPGDKGCDDDPSNVETLPCVIYKKVDLCYTLIDSTQRISRGCVSDYIKCDDENVCDICTATPDGCNNNVFRRCVECSSKKSKQCIRPENFTIESCVVNPDTPVCNYLAKADELGNCYTYYKDDLVERGCDKPTEYIPQGTELQDCSKDYCNAECKPDLKCIQCDANDERCNAQTNSLLPEADVCPSYTTFCQECRNTNTHQIRRQCGNISIESEWKCNSCYTDGCNNEVYSMLCFSCNSSEDADCGHSPEMNTYLKYCQDGDKCFAKIDENGFTIRGCLSEQPELECNGDDPECKICNETYCNGGIFPENRLQCYQCDKNNTECNFEEENADIQPSSCRLHIRSDTCYMLGNETTMSRGCFSDDDENSQACTDEKEKCFQCSKNKCNSLQYRMNSQLKCIKCETTNEECAWGFNVENADPCRNQILYYEKEGCFTYKYENNTVTRGCLYASEVCSEDDENCEICDTIGCNRKSTKSHECIRCNSAHLGQETCADQAQGIEPSKCAEPSQAYKDRVCYTLKYSDGVIRGCLIDLDERDRNSCLDPNYKDCDICSDSTDCNNKKAPNSAELLKSIPFCTLFILFLLNNIYVYFI